MVSPFKDVTFAVFKEEASAYFTATVLVREVPIECAKNGFKALTLLYFGHSADWSHAEINESVVIIEQAAKRLIEVEER